MSRREEHKKDLLKSWLQGNTNLKEEQQLERLAADDPFLAEALEGFRSVPEAEHATNIQNLKNRLNKKEEKRSTIIPIYLMRIAAGLAILVVSIIAFQWINNASEATMADNMSTAKEEQTAAPEKQLANEGEMFEDAKDAVSTVVTELDESQYISNNTGSISDDPLNVKPKLFVDKKEAINIQEEKGFVTADDDLASLEDNAIVVIEEVEAEPMVSPKMKRSTPAQGGGISPEKIAKDVASEVLPTVPLDILPDSATLYVLNGRVENEFGEPLIGATVSLVNTTRNTITDFNGDFKISMQDTQRGQLQINYTGYESQTVATTPQNNLRVTLREAQQALDEIAVADYAIKEDKVALKKRSKSNAKNFIDKRTPEPISGHKNYKLYIQKELNYPSLAKENNIQGIVRLEFIIDGSGTPTNFKVLKTLGFGCDAEAMFLIENGPKWSHPGKVVYEVEFKL